MERDYPAIEAVLKAVEGMDGEFGLAEALDPVVDSFGFEKVRHQARILQDKGYLEVWTPFEDTAVFRSEGFHPQAAGRLTWQGHDFLDAIREHDGNYDAAVEEVS